MPRPFAAILLLLFGLLAAGPALAHASLLGADPADGTVLAKAPASLSLKFNEQVAPVLLKLIEPDGRGVALKQFSLENSTVVIAAPTGLANGSYALSWRVISADGHPVGGTTMFSIGAPSAGGSPQEVEIVDWPVRIGIWASRTMTYLGLLVGIGGVFFARWISVSLVGLTAARRALAIGLAGLIPAVGFQGLDVLDMPIANIGSAEVWVEGLASSFGLSVGIAAAAMLLALLASLRVMGARWVSVTALLGVGLALTATGHAATAEPQWLTRPAVFVHVLGAAFWAGALVPLLLLLRAPTSETVPALRRFSAIIPFVLAAMVAAGATLAVIQLAEPAEIVRTAYGRVFIGKMALVALLLALGGYNRWRLTGAAEEAAGDARRRLAATIGLEAVLIIAIFGVVALWRFTPPPRALLEAAAEPAFVHIHTDKAMAELTITPGGVGPVDAKIYIANGDFGPLSAKQVTLQLANKARGIEPIERQAKLGEDGYWHVSGLSLPVGGQWQAEVDILVSEFQEVDLSDSIDIRP